MKTELLIKGVLFRSHLFSCWVINRVFNIYAPAMLEMLQLMKEYLWDAANFFRRGGGNVLLKTRDVWRLSLFFKIIFSNFKKIRNVILSPTLNKNLAILSHLVTKTKFIYLNKKNSHDEALPISQMNISWKSRKGDW